MKSSSLFVSFLCALLVTGFTISLAQTQIDKNKPERDPRRLTRLIPHETRDHEFVPVPREGKATSPAYRYSSGGFFFTQVNVDDSSRNILNDAANEPSIAVDPTNPNRMAIGWRQFNTITSNFRQAGFGYTTDGGMTWTFPGVIEPGIFRSDPVLDSDASGNFYYNSLTSSGGNFSCNVFKSTSGGATWDAGTFAQGGDKQWMVIDKTPGIGEGHIYAFWTQAFSACPPGFFTISADRGASYGPCDTIPEEPFWGTLDVDNESRLYVAGVGQTDFVVTRSSTARDSIFNPTWDFVSNVDLGGSLLAFGGITSPNPAGLHGQTWIAVDKSSGLTSGNVYLLGSVQPDSSTDPLDVMFSRSTDGGVTWSSAMRINDDSSVSAWQWFGTMSVAPNGRIDVVWLDTRDNPGTLLSSLYYSFSNDGGVTWSSNQRLSQQFDPHVGWPQQNKMGDYFHMVSDNSGAHLAWAATFNGEQDVYYGHITSPVDVSPQISRQPTTFTLEQNFPNPFNPSTTIRFHLPSDQHVTLTVFDLLGREVATLVDESYEAGSFSVSFNGNGLSSGTYLYRLKAGGFLRTERMILLR